MSEGSSAIVASFEANLESVARLSNFDKIVIDFATASIRGRDAKFREALKSKGTGYPERYSGERLIVQLEQLRDNERLRPDYSLMFKQCIVLQVSYFASALHDLFRYFFQRRIETGEANPILQEVIKISFGQLQEVGWDVRGNAADIFLGSRDISFQDMKSVKRSFKKWLGFGRDRDIVTDRIIVAQAARHCIVHAGGVANERTAGQIRGCTCDDVLPDLEVGELVEATPDDIARVGDAMQTYFNELRTGLLECV